MACTFAVKTIAPKECIGNSLEKISLINFQKVSGYNYNISYTLYKVLIKFRIINIQESL